MSFQGVNPQTGSPPAPRGAGASLELADLVAILRSRAGLILRVAALVIALAAVAVFLMPAKYSSSAAVMLDPRKNTVADLSSVLSALPTDPASVQNQIQVLESRDLAAEVIAKLKLYDDPEFNGAVQRSVGSVLLSALNPKAWLAGQSAPADPAAQRDAIVDAFLSHLSADTVGLSTTITVTFTSRDADKAALIANAVAQTYVEDTVASKLRASDATSAWLTQRIRDLGRQVQAEEAAALTYRAQHNLDSSAGGTSLIEAQLGGINTQIVQARADYTAKLAVYNQVQSLIRSGNPANISQIVASPLMIQLRAQQAELLRQRAALAVPYGPKHPKLVAADNALRDLDQKIAEEGARIASALSNDVAVARAQLGSLKGSLDLTQRTASGQDMIAVKLRALEAEADSSRKLYESFLARLTAIQDQEGLQLPDAHVISRAPVPNAPSAPPRLLIVLASIPGGLLLGCLLALLSARFAGRRSAAAVARPSPKPRPVPAPRPAPAFRDPPILTDMPGALAAGAADHIIDWPASPFARAVKALLARVAPAASSGGARIVAITTAQDDVSGTTVALALARVAAHAGLRTILVDGHINEPVIARQTGALARAGLLEVLRGTVPLSAALARDPRSNALFLSTLQPPADPQATLASPRIGELFRHLRRTSDLVIVAAPPVLPSRETPYFARLADAVVMVAQPGEQPRQPLAHALQALSQWQSPPVGMVYVR